jgi:hypothetical protein
VNWGEGPGDRSCVGDTSSAERKERGGELHDCGVLRGKEPRRCCRLFTLAEGLYTTENTGMHMGMMRGCFISTAEWHAENCGIPIEVSDGTIMK